MEQGTRAKHFHLQQTHKYPIYNFDHVQWTEFHVFTKLHKQKKNCPSCLADCFATVNVVHVIRHAHIFRIETEKAYFCRLAFICLCTSAVNKTTQWS